MRGIFKTIVLMIISVNGYCQCETGQLLLVDSTGFQIDSIQTNLIFIVNNGADTIHLDPLYNPTYTGHSGLRIFGTPPIDTVSNEPIKTYTPGYCVRCMKHAIKIVDSIDINKDGVKELFLLRQWNCSASPPNPGRFGIGIQQQSYSQYEIWDINSKKRIAEFKSNYHCSMAISTNVMVSNSYSYDLKINKDGSVELSNPFETGVEMGTYKYDKRSGSYVK